MSAKRLVYTTLLYICEGECPYRSGEPCIFSYIGAINRLGEPWEEKRLCLNKLAQAEADK